MRTCLALPYHAPNWPPPSPPSTRLHLTTLPYHMPLLQLQPPARTGAFSAAPFRAPGADTHCCPIPHFHACCLAWPYSILLHRMKRTLLPRVCLPPLTLLYFSYLCPTIPTSLSPSMPAYLYSHLPAPISARHTAACLPPPSRAL